MDTSTPEAQPAAAHTSSLFARSVTGSLDANGTMTVEDFEGHRIELRTPSPVAPFRLVAAIGDLAKNQHYVAMLTPLLAVASIDGEPVGPLDTLERIEGLIMKLGNAGVQAVSHAMLSELQRLMGPAAPMEAAAAS